MTTGPARRRRALNPAPTPPASPAPPMTRAERWGKRWREFASLMLLPDEDAKKFGELMQNIAEDWEAGEMEDGPFYDRMREATDLLPMSRKQAVVFAGKIRTLLQGTWENKHGGHE